MRVLVTGGAGYIGTGLVDKLVSSRDLEEIIIYDNLSRENYSFFLGATLDHPEKVTFVDGDILDSRKVRKYLEGIDTVIHLAAKVTTPFANTHSHFFEQVNHWGTAELVYALEESNVRRLIYLSSTSVYGRSKDLAREDKVPNPQTFYGISKFRGEQHVMRLFDKMQTYVLRCGNVYGYNKSVRFDSVINRFIFDANYKQRITINGNGTQARAFIHVDTITEILAALITAEIEPGIYNTVSHNLQILDLVDIMKNIYPQLEFMFINQHLNLRGIKVQPNKILMDKMGLNKSRDMELEFREFIKQLPFGSLSGVV